MFGSSSTCYLVAHFYKHMHAQCLLQHYLQLTRYGQTQMSISRRMDKEEVVRIYSGIPLDIKELDNAICSYMDGLWWPYAKWSKSHWERQMLHDTKNVESKVTELVNKTKRSRLTDTENKQAVTSRERDERAMYGLPWDLFYFLLHWGFIASLGLFPSCSTHGVLLAGLAFSLSWSMGSRDRGPQHKLLVAMSWHSCPMAGGIPVP